MRSDIAAALHRASVADRRARTAEARLSVLLEETREAICVFDADDKLVAWNERVGEVFADATELLVRGTRFEDLVRAAVARGQFPSAAGREEAWIAERIALHRRTSSDREEQLPGGRRVRIADRQTADGGRVCIASEITAAAQRATPATGACRPLDLAMAAYDRLAAGVIVADRDGRVV